MPEHAHQVSAHIGPGSVSVTRTGTRTYEGMNERGSTVRIGPVEAEGHFTPGELLKLALVGCAGMSSDRVAARRLGEDYAITIWAHGTSDHKENRYLRIDEELLVDLSGLAESERSALIDIMSKAIDRGCTVARSVHDSIDLETTIDGTPA
ncbi:OsmC family protein [Agromyces sp. ISL-38]|uniref:OsmC family protein n=1 Tax=Agromyces sp. ISL-38 TaxID=2819107 RepID=UPI001BE846F7|nr:OsmC family protein [Agromyces sp. ISL-38]MBT2498653.1 OsmC family protein [Agromyces sp. ISL-38]MBT2518520.1 OsmC family protein [Streptomyces sp. ISL-90]